MADEMNIEQNIILNYKTNANEASKEIDSLNSSYEAVNNEKKEGIEVNKKEEQAYKTMKAQIKEATIEYQKLAQTYGVTSKEALNAAQNVARLKDELDETKDFSDAFNPDQKMTALATSAQVAGIGLQGVTSGMALFGEQNEDVEKQLLKVQAAMAFSDSIAGIFDMAGEIGKLEAQARAMWVGLTTAKTAETTANEINTASKAKNIAVTEGGAVATGALTGATTIQTIATTGATIATNLFNASLAILTAPITLLIVGIAGLVAGIGYLTGAFGDFDGSAAKAEQANKKLSKEIDEMAKATEKSNEQMEMSNNHSIEMAKAQGKSATEVRKLKEELINQEVAEKRLNAVKAYSIYLEAQRVAGLEDATEAQKETAKKATELYKDQNGIYNASLKERKQMALNHRVEIVQEETDKEKAILEKQKEAQKKRAEERRKADEDEKKRLEDLKKSLLDAETNYIKTIQDIQDKSEEQKLARQKERDLEAIELLRKKGADVANLLVLNEEKYNLLEQDLRNKRAEEQKERDKALAEKKAEEDKANADKQLEIDNALLQQKQEIEDAKINIAQKGIQLLASVFGKSKAVQKAAIIAENAVGIGKMIIDNNRANIGALATPQAIATSGASAAPVIALNNVTTGIGIASSIAATAKALSAVGGGGSGASAGGSQVAAMPSGGSAPQVGFQSSSENQIATSVSNAQQGVPPVQAFVVSNEVTNAQQIDRNRIESNSF
jgi:DNA repair exonuclease SbcCD ATPase subunit